MKWQPEKVPSCLPWAGTGCSRAKLLGTRLVVSPHANQSSLVQLLHLSIGPGLAHIPLGKGTALEHGVGEGGSPEQSQRLKRVGPEGGMEVSRKGRTSQASGITLPARTTAHKPRRSPGQGRRAEGQGEAEARTTTLCVSPCPTG